MRNKREHVFLTLVSAVFLLLIFMTQVIIFAQNNGQANYYFYIYGEHECPHCGAMFRFLVKTYGREHVIFCDISGDKTCMDKFSTLVSMGFPAAVPLTFIVYNGTISAVILGEAEDKQFIDGLLHLNMKNTVPIYAGTQYGGVMTLTNGHEEFIRKFLSYIPGHATSTTTSATVTTTQSSITTTKTSSITTTTTTSNGGIVVINQTGNIYSIIPALVVLSLIDSVNPCTIILYITFVLSFIASGRTGIWPGVIFILIVMTGYYLLGMGLYYVAAFIPPMVIVGLVALMSIYNIISLAVKKSEKSFKCEWCEKLSFLNRLVSSPYILAVLLGLFSVVVLLPCSSGPLLVFVSMIRNMQLIIASILLVFYCIIFVLPLMIILVTMVYLKKTYLSKWIIENSDLIKFVTSIAMLLIVLVLVSS